MRLLTRRTWCPLLAIGLLLSCGGRPDPAAEPAPNGPTTADPQPTASEAASDLRGIFFATRPSRAVSRLAIRLVDGDHFTRVPASRVFAAAESIRFEIRSNRSAQFTILHASGDGPLRAIWPPPDQPSLGRIDAGGTRVVPPAPGLIVFDARPGVERFRVVLTEEPAPGSTAARSAGISQIFLRSGERLEQTAFAVEPEEGYLYFGARDDTPTAAVEVALHHR